MTKAAYIISARQHSPNLSLELMSMKRCSHSVEQISHFAIGLFIGLDEVLEIFARGEVFLNPSDLLRGGGLEFLPHGRRDTGCAGRFEEGFEFDLVHGVEGFVEELMEGDVLEEMTGMFVGSEGRRGGVGGHGV